ncbi:hypothetical protein [Pseudodesulfovibrio sp.]|uniref:hypothetical protein n=1 Tax=unclassified Pseudodesulfovibrio TaxID=2661612 RepID=UPI003AFF9D94
MKTFKIIGTLVLLFTLAGCGKTVVGSSGLLPESLIENTKTVEASQGAVEVSSSLPSQLFVVDSADFRQGLENAFAAAGVFAGGKKKYDVRAEIVKLDYPSFGTGMEAEYVVDYEILDATGHVIGEKKISSKGYCSMGEHFLGSARVYQAIQKAVEHQYPLIVEYIWEVVGADLEKNKLSAGIKP